MNRDPVLASLRREEYQADLDMLSSDAFHERVDEEIERLEHSLGFIDYMTDEAVRDLLIEVCYQLYRDGKPSECLTDDDRVHDAKKKIGMEIRDCAERLVAEEKAEEI